MNKDTILWVVISLLVGFIGGFLLANSINRSEINALRAQGGRQQNLQTNTNSASEFTLSDAELRAKIEEADKNPTNFAFQKELGIALYRYGAMNENVRIIGESRRILERANTLNNRDFDILVALGNAYFDVAFATKDGVGFEKARELYLRALEIQPDDVNVQTDIGISYFWQPSPDYNKAVAQLEKVLSADPTHTRSMYYLARSYLKLGKITNAEKLVDKIKNINPTQNGLAELTAELASTKAGQDK